MKVRGLIRVPGDKSISHRALMFAALAEGTSEIRDILPSADVHSTAGVLGALGAAVPPLSPAMTIHGGGLRSLHAARTDLDCGNSGTTARLMAGIAAACWFTSRFVGDASLSRRPMRRVARPLAAMGARIDLEGGDGLPMIVRGGALTGIDWRTETASAQLKSAILLAGLVGGVTVTVTEPSPTRDHTERMMRALGVKVESSGARVRLTPATRLSPLEITVPADPSSAAFLAALATLADDGELELTDVCLNPTRTGFFRALERMGGRLTIESTGEEGGEPVGRIRVGDARLRGIAIGGSEVPAMIDEIPLLACLAARAEGETVITGAGELRVKESDRIATVVSNLRALGIDASELPDGMRIVGNPSAAPLRGSVRTHGDHRIAMAFGVLGALDGGQVEIDDRACVSVSYPNFWDDLRRSTA